MREVPIYTICEGLRHLEISLCEVFRERKVGFGSLIRKLRGLRHMHFAHAEPHPRLGLLDMWRA